jgi:single-stranded-DNA-specific exonuclease
MTKKWQILSHDPEDLITQLLENRGITKKEDIEKFFNPKFEDFESELKIPGIAKARDRIEKAIKEGEQIIIYGDYDVDGICATALMYHALASRGAKVLPYIPHREKEGYGMSEVGLHFARDAGATLIVTVDQGIVAFEQIIYAQMLGIDVIITDHHVALETLPGAVAIVHSTKMCGAAVAWCLARTLVSEKEAMELLDFAGMGSICDMMPMVGVSRLLAKEGIKRLNKTPRLGIQSLLNACSIETGEITSYHISHIIGPRLNAMGRMEHAIDSLRLLCTKSPKKASDLAKLLCDTNEQKKQLTVDAIDQARLISEQVDDEIKKDRKILVVHSKDWIPGIIGLVAARLSEEYNLPAIAIAEGELESKGSARTVNGLNIVETIRGCSDLLIEVGGHPQAAGFSLKSENIEAFKQKISQAVKDVEVPDEPVLKIDSLISSKRLTKKLTKELEEFEPTGVSNAKPILASENVRISDIRTVGQGKHLKCKIDDIDAIAFGMGDKESFLKNGQLVNVAYFLELNVWNNHEKVQLKIVDLQIIEP